LMKILIPCDFITKYYSFTFKDERSHETIGRILVLNV
jgi:hypothetical protein